MNRLGFLCASIVILASSSASAASLSTTTTLTSSNPSSVHGEEVVLAVHVETSDGKEPSGVIKIHDGPSNVYTATYPAEHEFHVSTFTTRRHELVAEFVGNAEATASRSTVLEQVINKADTITTVVLDANPATANRDEGLLVFVQPVAPGRGFVSGDVLVQGGANPPEVKPYPDSWPYGRFPVRRPNSPGSYPVAANYVGSDDFNPSTATVVQNVVEGGTTLSVEHVLASRAQYVSLAARIVASAGTLSGTVRFSEEGRLLFEGPPNPSGLVWHSVSDGFAPGTHRISVEYVGDSTHGSLSTTLFVEVMNDREPGSGVGHQPARTSYGESVRLRTGESILQVPQGTYEYFDGEQLLGTSYSFQRPVPGTHVAVMWGEYPTCVLSPGMHSLRARYRNHDGGVQPMVPWVFLDHEVLGGDSDAGPYTGACKSPDAGSGETPLDAGPDGAPDAAPPGPGNPSTPSEAESSGCQSSTGTVPMGGVTLTFAVLAGGLVLRKKRRASKASA
ncbi:Ig-like domain-containing protein [Pendulispora rubella]|uniref:Ig-like domain-containing protein n=1 Tax=Pendulispora rubella TaxID=2741070 RepID=A0ABZ2L8R1_9BACT